MKNKPITIDAIMEKVAYMGGTMGSMMPSSKDIIVKSIKDIVPVEADIPGKPVFDKDTSKKKAKKILRKWKEHREQVEAYNNSLQRYSPNTELVIMVRDGCGYKNTLPITYTRLRLRNVIALRLDQDPDALAITIPKASRKRSFGADNEDRAIALKGLLSEVIGVDVASFTTDLEIGITIGEWNKLKEIKVWVSQIPSLTYMPDPAPAVISISIAEDD